MRICSLLPSATEIVCALGLDAELVAVTHECDYPAAALAKPHVTRSAIDYTGSSSREIHTDIRRALHRGSSIYHLNQALLEQLLPDLILTQELCDVCAVSYREVRGAVRTLPGSPKVLSLEPNTLEAILETIRQVGSVTGRQLQAASVVEGLQTRVSDVTRAVAEAPRQPRVLCLEWLDPPMVGGHWVPEMVKCAGGMDGMGKPGEPSFQVSWEQVLVYRPEVVVLMPCGFHLRETVEEAARIPFPHLWHQLPAVQNGQVFAVDGSSYFNRPGPRIVDGLEILAELLHPTRMPGLHGPQDFCRLPPLDLGSDQATEL